jgi:uncharacterized repeat protein (TIGR01451 family)
MGGGPLSWRTWAGWYLALLSLVSLLWPLSLHAQEADCAEVKIVIEQKLSLERQAFDAHMVIRNGLEGAISDVRIELIYQDQDQQPVVATTDPNAVGATFFQRIDRMEGLNSLDGGTLPGKTTADIHWLLIPSQGAGGDIANGRLYYIGAKVTYTLAGETTSVEVTPDFVIVRPQPLLVLDYFLPSDVYADDALTPQVEPIEPFTLGVRIANTGAGASAHTTIESAQPKIVENHQGLLIDFLILGGYVGNDMAGKSLLLDFGDIPGQQARVGRWLMQTTLAGRFLDFNASFTHADSLGGAVTSLIQDVRTHVLVHDVLVDLAGHDDIYDFLAEFGNGYWVYDSNGGDAEVADASKQASLSNLSSTALRLTFPPSSNLVHAKVADPFKGAKTIARVLRGDGKVLPSQNYWLSKTRNADLSWSYFLHVFDSNSTGQYTLEFAQGTTATLSGSAYRDSNANGVRDTGELPEGNLGIVLKGVDAGGQNVLNQAYTDPAGAFSFTGLAPGRYQLEAAVVDGWINGVWTAGGAGGSAQPGLIKDIVLTAGTTAQGYLISKRKPDTAPTGEQADLSIAIQASRSQLRGGETASVTVTMRNAGEASAQGVAAQLTIPDGLTLQGSSASLGAYANGAWTLGGLNPGQDATLTLEVKADPVSGSQDRTISWPASVTANTADPSASNNSALLGLTVLADQAATMELTQELPAQARVLMLLSCPQTDVQDQPACEQQAAQDAQTLTGRVQQLHTVTTLADWNTAQRGNRYNVLWLHGGAEKLDTQALAEINAAVRRGATVMADGLPGPASGDLKINQLASILGVRIESALGGQSVKFPNDPTEQPVAGTLYGLQPQASAQGMATAGSETVMARATWGHGQAWTIGFDLLATIQQGAAFWDGYTDQQLLAFTPVSRADPALAGGSLPLKATVRSNAPQGEAPQEASVQVQLPPGVTYADALPTPARAEAQQVEWTWQLDPGASADGQLRLILPQTPGDLQVQTSLLDGNAEVLDVLTQTITVIGADDLAPQVGNALAVLSSGDPNAQTLIDQASQAADAAKAAQILGEWNTTLQELARLQAALDELAAPPYQLPIDAIRLDVARWIGAAQQQWTPTGGTGGQPARLLAQSGSGQSATVSTAFANPLTARVEDDQGQPVAGVTVRFTAPASGASARFGASASVEAITNAQGLAPSPALTANATAGSYAVTAEAAGLTPVNFNLTNTGTGTPIDTPASLRLVSGNAQTAQVGTAFGAPMVVEVLNAAGQPLPGVEVRFGFAASGPSASFGGNRSATVTTGGNGQASSPVFTANNVVGAHQASVTVAGMGGALSVNLANSQAAPTLQLEAIDGMSQSAPVNTAYGQRMIVRVTDGQGNPKPGVAVQFSLPASGPSASFTRLLTASVNTAADGTAMSPPMIANGQQGAFQAVVTAEGVAQPLYGAFTNLSGSPGPNPGKRFEGVPVTGGGVMSATISGGGDTCVFNPSATRMIAATGELSPNQKPFKLPFGLFEFELVGCDVGSTVTVSTTWPDLKGVSGYVKHGQTADSKGNGIWYVPGSMRIEGNTISYAIQDGGKGDDDLTANGIIRDPGGPAFGPLALDPDGAVGIPTLSQWAMALLATLLALSAVRARRKQ